MKLSKMKRARSVSRNDITMYRGRVSMTVYDSGRDLLELGIVPLENMIPETALVKAMWAYGNSSNADEIKELMLRNIASEFSFE